MKKTENRVCGLKLQKLKGVDCMSIYDVFKEIIQIRKSCTDLETYDKLGDLIDKIEEDLK